MNTHRSGMTAGLLTILLLVLTATEGRPIDRDSTEPVRLRLACLGVILGTSAPQTHCVYPTGAPYEFLRL